METEAKLPVPSERSSGRKRLSEGAEGAGLQQLALSVGCCLVGKLLHG